MRNREALDIEQEFAVDWLKCRLCGGSLDHEGDDRNCGECTSCISAQSEAGLNHVEYEQNKPKTESKAQEKAEPTAKPKVKLLNQPKPEPTSKPKVKSVTHKSARDFTTAGKSLIAKVHGFMPTAQLLDLLNERMALADGARRRVECLWLSRAAGQARLIS